LYSFHVVNSLAALPKAAAPTEFALIRALDRSKTGVSCTQLTDKRVRGLAEPL